MVVAVPLLTNGVRGSVRRNAVLKHLGVCPCTRIDCSCVSPLAEIAAPIRTESPGGSRAGKIVTPVRPGDGATAEYGAVGPPSSCPLAQP